MALAARARTTIVVVHRNRPEKCRRTIDAFVAQGEPVAVTVVDNGSSPDAIGQLQLLGPGVEIVAAGRNLGFGPGANVGLRRWLVSGGGDWVVVAPHDALPEADCLTRLLDAVHDRPRVGMVSAEYGQPGKPVVDRYFGGILVDSERRPGWEAAGHAHGTLLLLRRACLEEIGLFDERYFAYCEEADLSVRARRAGWEVGIVWGAVVRNPGMSTPAPVIDYLMVRNSLLLVRDHFGRYPTAIRLAMALYDSAANALWRRPPSPFFSGPARRHAIHDFLRGRFGPPPPALLRAGAIER